MTRDDLKNLEDENNIYKGSDYYYLIECEMLDKEREEKQKKEDEKMIDNLANSIEKLVIGIFEYKSSRNKKNEYVDLFIPA